METRPQAFIFISGMPDTGKSYQAKKIANNIPGKKLVVSYTGGQETWKGTKFIRPTDENPKPLRFKRGFKHLKFKTPGLKKPFEAIYDNYEKGCLVLDDMRNYVRSNWESTPGLIPCITDYRHKGYDLIMIAHSIKQLPPSLWAFVRHIFIFSSNVIPKQKDLEISKAAEIIDMQIRVNKRYQEAQQNGKFSKGIYEYAKL